MNKLKFRCIGKCFSCDGKQNTTQKEADPVENVPSLTNTTAGQVATSSTSGVDEIETFQTYVERLTREAEDKNDTKKTRHESTFLHRCFAFVMCRKCSAEKQNASFWIEPAPGYPERRNTDVHA